MRSLLAKFALSTAMVAGVAIAAQACPQQTTASKDTSATASFQLAQSGGSGGNGGGSTGGSGSSTGTGGSGSGTGTGSSGTQSPGTTSGSGQTDWPKKDAPGAPGTSPQTSK